MHHVNLFTGMRTHCKPIATVECAIAIGRYETSRFSLVELKPETGRKHQ